MSCMCNGAGKAVGMRFDLHSNGVGDQVDQSCVEVQIDGSVEIVFILVCRDAQGRGTIPRGQNGRCRNCNLRPVFGKRSNFVPL